MGAKYEVRWSINNACPFTHSEWTNSLLLAIASYVKVVVGGNTNVSLTMHDWRECPNPCLHELLCPGRKVG